MTRPPGDPVDEESCQRILRAIDIIGVRWTGPILLAAARGARRFKEYRAMVPGISDPQLALRLKQLQSRRLIERTVIPTTPVQITYALTPDAEELIAALGPLSHWSENHLPPHDTGPGATAGGVIRDVVVTRAAGRTRGGRTPRRLP